MILPPFFRKVHCSGFKLKTFSTYFFICECQAQGDPSCKRYSAQLKDAPHFIFSCLVLEAKCWELLRHAPPQLQELDLPRDQLD